MTVISTVSTVGNGGAVSPWLSRWRRAQPEAREPEAPTRRSDVGEALADGEHGAIHAHVQDRWCQVIEVVQPGFRGRDPAKYAGKQIHEIHPVKFGGSPTDPANKVALTPAEHAKYTTFWNRQMKELRK